MISEPTREILRILQQRAEAGSKPKSRNDGYHIALAIEGGGMVAVNAGGMVSALESLGLRDSFDSVHASSAGVGAGAYFIARDAKAGSRIFQDHLNTKKFIDVSRFLKGKPIMDTSFLIDDVMVRDLPLDIESVISGDLPIYVSSTDIDSGEVDIVREFRDEDHFRKVLSGSIAMPFVAGPAVEIAGRRFLDGGMIEQFALTSAVGHGATHVLVLFTRREVRLKRTIKPVKTLLESIALQMIYGGKTGAIFRNRLPKLHSDIDKILSGSSESGVSLGYLTLAPEVADLKRLTTDKTKLDQACEESYEHVIACCEYANESGGI